MSNHARPRITEPAEPAPEKDSGTGPELNPSDAVSATAPSGAPSAPDGTAEHLPVALQPAGHSLSGRFGRLTLQRRLLLALIGSLAMICAVIGLLINAGMRQTLSSQLNEQLTFAADRAEAYSKSQGHTTNPAPLFAPGQAGSGTLNAKIVSNLLFAAGVLDEKTGERKDLVSSDTLPLSQLVVGAPPVVKRLSIGDYLLTAQLDPGKRRHPDHRPPAGTKRANHCHPDVADRDHLGCRAGRHRADRFDNHQPLVGTAETCLRRGFLGCKC